MAKNNFILYKDFDTTLDLLNDEQAGRLFKALYKYVNGRHEPNFKDGMLIVAFNMLKTQLERDLEKYNKRITANQENGKLGGRPKKKPTKPNGLKKTQHNPTKGDSVSDSVSGSERDSVKKDKKISKKVYFSNQQLNELFYDYLQMRIKIKKPATDKAIELAINKLNKLDSDILRKEMLENSVLNNYQGLFLPKDNNPKKEDTRKFTN